jgi:DNA-binding transcriptional ArsR family regulator
MVIDPALIPAVAARFKVLGDPGRLAILSALQSGEKSVGDLVTAVGRSQPNVSQQLAALAQARFVAMRREGSRVFYRVADPWLAHICEAVCDSLAGRLRAEQKVMKKLEGDRRRARAGARR